MKMLKVFLLLIVMILLSSLNSRVVYASGCGLVPLKPLIPLGCKDLRPECVCDSQGQNCHWEWVCVK
jgi:hypothetical protein